MKFFFMEVAIIIPHIVRLLITRAESWAPITDSQDGGGQLPAPTLQHIVIALIDLPPAQGWHLHQMRVWALVLCQLHLWSFHLRAPEEVLQTWNQALGTSSPNPAIFSCTPQWAQHPSPGTPACTGSLKEGSAFWKALSLYSSWAFLWS